MALLRRLKSLRAMRLWLRSVPSPAGRSSRSPHPPPHSSSKLQSLVFPLGIISGFGAAAVLGSSPMIVFACENDAQAPDLASDPTPRIPQELKIFIGYDPREHIAFEICRHSMLKHSTVPLKISPIKQSELRSQGLYTRIKDPTESTEFSFTRFLTPFLAGFSGWAMFVDCDFLYTGDIRELLELLEDRFAVMCVQHDYTPKSETKMDGVVQTRYPRKNWSSMVLYNCGHEKNRVLTPQVVNSETGAFLHRFQWLQDAEIGDLPFTWNFLVGHNEMPAGQLPRAIHYTCGGPWFDAWKDCEYAEVWLRERDEFLAGQKQFEIEERGQDGEQQLQPELLQNNAALVVAG